jgi:hypothetical protein
VVALCNHDPEMPAPTLLGRLHEHTCRVDREPRGVAARVPPHRIDHTAQERSAALDHICERRARQVHALALEDFLLSIQGRWSANFCVITCAMRPGPATERGMGRSGSSAIKIGDAALASLEAARRYFGRTVRTRTTLTDFLADLDQRLAARQQSLRWLEHDGFNRSLLELEVAPTVAPGTLRRSASGCCCAGSASSRSF